MRTPESCNEMQNEMWDLYDYADFQFKKEVPCLGNNMTFLSRITQDIFPVCWRGFVLLASAAAPWRINCFDLVNKHDRLRIEITISEQPDQLHPCLKCNLIKGFSCHSKFDDYQRSSIEGSSVCSTALDKCLLRNKLVVFKLTSFRDQPRTPLIK